MKKTLWIIIIFIGLLYYHSIGESVDFKVIFEIVIALFIFKILFNITKKLFGIALVNTLFFIKIRYFEKKGK